MKYDLKTVRQQYGYSIEEMGNFMGIMPPYYNKYEKEGEVPSKYIYRLWLKLPDFPIPKDFFKYTSFVLKVNMVYHGMTQTEIAQMFGFSTQSTISSMLAQNIPMYELKEKFHNFRPFIIPVINIDDENNESDESNELFSCDESIQLFPCRCINSLTVRGNFIAIQKKKEAKLQKQMLGIS